jgi:glycosyltransferase involved in cell wall biosynthesis
LISECLVRSQPSTKSGRGLKIAYVHNYYIGYRLPFFEKLAKLFEIMFFFDQIDNSTTVRQCFFPCTVLTSIQVLKSSVYDLTWSPTLLFHLLKGKYHFFIGSGIGHIGTIVTFGIARLLRKPFVLWNEGWYYPTTFLRSLRQPLFNMLIKRSTAFVVPGLKAREFFLKCGVDPEKIFVAPNASSVIINDGIMSETSELKEMLGISGKIVVLYFGRLVRRKGVSVLIKAFSKLQNEMNNSVLVIAGEGEQREELENLCLRLKAKNVIFVGYVDENEKGMYYSMADLFVLPSIAHSGEVWDLVINEAMSLGKPVISTNAAGASHDMIKDGINGYIVKEGDVEALFKTIRKMLKNPERMRKMGLESKKIAENDFSFNNMVRGFVKAIRYSVTQFDYNSDD